MSVAAVERGPGPVTDGADRPSGADARPDQLRPMCHDLCQPLAAIMMLAAAAATEADVPESTRTRLDQITTEASWMASIIRDALDEGAAEDIVDLRDTARETAAEPNRTNATCRVHIGDRPVRLRANATLLRRAVANLLDNAYRAAGPGGIVHLAVRRSGAWGVVEVEDSGPGYGRIQQGSGLGLGVVALAAAKYGGKVNIGRSRLGGTRVQLRLCLVR